jgi:hypothetical protein
MADEDDTKQQETQEKQKTTKTESSDKKSLVGRFLLKTLEIPNRTSLLRQGTSKRRVRRLVPKKPGIMIWSLL